VVVVGALSRKRLVVCGLAKNLYCPYVPLPAGMVIGIDSVAMAPP